MSAWDRDCTMRYLNACPLAPEFRWPHRDGGERPVRPVHHEVSGYGKWLRETPYFPGLFELAHELMDAVAHIPEPAWPPIDPTWLAGELEALRKKHPEVISRPGESIAHQLRRVLPVPGQQTLF